MYKHSATDFPEIETIELTTANDRTWFCPRQDIERIHAEMKDIGERNV